VVESLIEPELLLGQVITASRQAVKHSPRGDKAMRDGREQRQQQQQQQPWQHRPWPHRRSQTVSLFFFQVSTETEHKPKLNATLFLSDEKPNTFVGQRWVCVFTVHLDLDLPRQHSGPNSRRSNISVKVQMLFFFFFFSELRSEYT
jgi:hypothetical protein